MILPGLVSVTFRKLSPATIIDLVKQADLQAIEWGGDIHVPHGDLSRARDVRNRTADAGLAVAAYGSYYRVGCSAKNGLSFQSVLDTAVTLGAPLIRVWAGDKSSRDADVGHWNMIVEESRVIAEAARSAGVLIAYEYHGGTLADTPATTIRLLHEVNHSNAATLWQPVISNSVDENLQALRQVLPHVANVHVFYWRPIGPERCSLAEGAAHWREYLRVLLGSGRDHYALIEFVRGDEPAAFLADARVLRQILSGACI